MCNQGGGKGLQGTQSSFVLICNLKLHLDGIKKSIRLRREEKLSEGR